MSVLVLAIVCCFGIACGRWLRPRADRAQSGRVESDGTIAALLGQVGARIASLETERARSTGMLVGQLRELRASDELLRRHAQGLERALREPLGRGQWGELQLRRVVELAGLTEHCRDFATQTVAYDEAGARLRPDMVVALPNGHSVVIDAKAPLAAYLDATAADDDDQAQPHLLRHAQAVRAHVRELSARRYDAWIDGSVPDLVVLFLPAEHLFAAAVRLDAELIEWSYRRGVMLASPSTLLTLLHAVAHGWREERLSRDAAGMAAAAREVHGRLATMAEHLALVGRRLDGAVEAYNQAVGSLERRVLPSARRIHDLDPGAGYAIDAPDVVERRARPLTAPELRETDAEPAGAA